MKHTKKKTKKKPEVVIEDWAIKGNEYVVALCCLYGEAQNHPRHGTNYVTTSAIEGVSEDLCRVDTYNTIYKLGAPNKDRIEHSDRLIKKLKDYWEERNGHA